MTDIRGRVAVVTGGASGIGRGIAEALMEEGASVAIADIELGVAEATAAELNAGAAAGADRAASEGRGEAVAKAFAVDVSKPESVEALKDAVLAEFGRVDIVVNNAGVGPFGLIKNLTLADWQWVLSVNLWGVIHGVTTFLPVLLANPEGGHILNTGSVASFASAPSGGIYNAAKHAVAAITETLALELEAEGSKVHTTLLAPGTVSTNIGTSSRNRPPGLEGALEDVDISKGVAKDARFIRPITAGRIAVRAIRNNDLYAATHPDWWPLIKSRQERIEADWLKYPVMEDTE